MIVPVETQEQIRIVADLAYRIWHEHYVPIIGQAQVDYMLDKRHSREAIQNQIENEAYQYFLAVNADDPIGYCAIILKPDELFLSKLYVEKRGRGTGIGREMMLLIEQEAKTAQVSKIRLVVNKKNTGSIAFYEKAGFINAGSIVTDIGNGFVMDDYTFEKYIATKAQRPQSKSDNEISGN